MANSQEAKLEQMLASFAEEARKKLKSALVSSSVPEEWLKNADSFLLQKAVLDSVCRDRPYKPRNPDHQAEFDNLHVTL